MNQPFDVYLIMKHEAINNIINSRTVNLPLFKLIDGKLNLE